MDRAFASGAKGRRFESCQAYQFLQLHRPLRALDGEMPANVSNSPHGIQIVIKAADRAGINLHSIFLEKASQFARRILPQTCEIIPNEGGQ
jgi:hypothetical protein